jgi:lincosamide nucleotidyltransferase A/C/D/E
VNRPPFWIKITGGINAVVWRLPLSHRVKALLSGSIYRNPPMSAARAVETLEALERADVAVCCMGGWGIDALTGEQNRKHRDLDLIVERKSWEAALRALAGLGYEKWYEQFGENPLEDRVVVRDAAMRVVDVHPVDLDAADLAIVSGAIAGHPVRCISAEQQYHSHQGFRKRLLHERRSQRSNKEIARRVLETESGSLQRSE